MSQKEPSKAPEIDALTGLPVLSSVHRQVREELKKHGEIGFVFFDVAGFHKLQDRYGKAAGRALLGLIGRTIVECRGKLFRDEDLVVVHGPGADTFAVFLFSPPRRKQQFSPEDLKLVRQRIVQRLTEAINGQREALGIHEAIGLYSGATAMLWNARKGVRRLVEEAQQEASYKAQLEDVMAGFVSNVSHELRTPLTCIEGYAETLLGGAMNDPELCARWLQIIYDESRRLERLIKDLLELSRVDARSLQVRLQAVDVRKMIEDTAAVLAPHAQKSQVSLSVDAPGDLPAVSADEDRIRQVLLNLTDNAIKYSRPNDRVRIEARASNGIVRIAVVDTGIGIPPADVGKVFERFYRVDKGLAARRSGRGLGLALARLFVEAHGGTITVRSQLEKGSVFEFTLPVEGAESVGEVV
jgi:signal transduction histidine kinase